MSELEKAFLRFANYGNASTTGYDMTAKNFSKMCKECDVMDGKNVNNDDVEIAFNKVRMKGARTINYIEFLQAMKVLSGKLFSKKLPEDALQATFKLLEGKEPANGEETKCGMVSEVERQTDTKKHLNSHTQRFNKSRKDEGIAEHSDVAQGTSHIAKDNGSGT